MYNQLTMDRNLYMPNFPRILGVKANNEMTSLAKVKTKEEIFKSLAWTGVGNEGNLGNRMAGLLWTFLRLKNGHSIPGYGIMFFFHSLVAILYRSFETLKSEWPDRFSEGEPFMAAKIWPLYLATILNGMLRVFPRSEKNPETKVRGDIWMLLWPCFSFINGKQWRSMNLDILLFWDRFPQFKWEREWNLIKLMRFEDDIW